LARSFRLEPVGRDGDDGRKGGPDQGSAGCGRHVAGSRGGRERVPEDHLVTRDRNTRTDDRDEQHDEMGQIRHGRNRLTLTVEPGVQPADSPVHPAVGSEVAGSVRHEGTNPADPDHGARYQEGKPSLYMARDEIR
jgi:hypothetical protein